MSSWKGSRNKMKTEREERRKRSKGSRRKRKDSEDLRKKGSEEKRRKRKDWLSKNAE